MYTPNTGLESRYVESKGYNSNRFSVSQRYWNVIKRLPNNERVPEALMKIGLISGDIRAKETRPGIKISVDKSTYSSKRTPEVDSSPRLLCRFREYMLNLCRNNTLSNTDKQCIGEIITYSGLYLYPTNVDGSIVGSNVDGDYRDIVYDTAVDEFGLDESYEEYVSRGKKNNKKIVNSENELKERRDKIQDDIINKSS